LKGYESELCNDCRERMKKNPLRVIDCKVPSCKTIVKNAPKTVDYLDEECKTHFEALKDTLTKLGIDFEVDTGIVRGLDYYTKTVFEMFFRSNPFKGGYSVFAGLEPLLKTIQNFHFEKSDIDWLKSLGIFEKDFLEYIAGFKFSGNIWAMKEGSLVFPNEPLIRIEADTVEALLLEGLILNMINFQTLIATKTARIWLASKKGSIMEFGLRRAQGNDGAMSATRAA